MKNYESETTLFLKQLKLNHPELVQKQRQGRARLWDKTIDSEQQAQYNACRVYQKPYVYQTNK